MSAVGSCECRHRSARRHAAAPARRLQLRRAVRAVRRVRGGAGVRDGARDGRRRGRRAPGGRLVHRGGARRVAGARAVGAGGLRARRTHDAQLPDVRGRLLRLVLRHALLVLRPSRTCHALLSRASSHPVLDAYRYAQPYLYFITHRRTSSLCSAVRSRARACNSLLPFTLLRSMLCGSYTLHSTECDHTRTHDNRTLI